MEKCFLDSNLLCYFVDTKEPKKREKAKNLFADLLTNNSVQISTQVIQEFINFTIRKLCMPKSEVAKLVDSFSKQFPVHTNTIETITQALQISIETQFSFWDSLILSAAIESGCTILYSEDLNNGQTIHGIKIVNPFLQN